MLPNAAEHKPSYFTPRHAQRERSMFLEYLPGILFFVVLDCCFGWWYYHRLQAPSIAQIARQEVAKPAATDQSAVLVLPVSQHRQLLLEPGQECLGGRNGVVGTVIVRSVQNKVHVFTQLVENGRPLQCVVDHCVN